MTYLRFHGIFNLPLFVAFLALQGLGPSWAMSEWVVMAVVLILALAFTIPWDNYAAKWGIWSYPAGKYGFKIGFLPMEEYLFIVLQTLNVILATRTLLVYCPSFLTHIPTTISGIQYLLLTIVLGVWVLTCKYAYSRTPLTSTRYLFHLGFWFGPVVLIQWIIAPEVLGSHIGLLMMITLGFGIYYTFADWVAVSRGIWTFDQKQVTGITLFGHLPLEEVAFFSLTSLLVVQSYILLLPANLR